MTLRDLPGRAGNSGLTDLAARKFVESHGSKALAILEERALLAEELGHALAARTWRELFAAARRVLRRQGAPGENDGGGRAIAAPAAIGGVLYRRVYEVTRPLRMVIPAQAGIHPASACAAEPWVPACAGIAVKYSPVSRIAGSAVLRPHEARRRRAP